MFARSMNRLDRLTAALLPCVLALAGCGAASTPMLQATVAEQFSPASERPSRALEDQAPARPPPDDATPLAAAIDQPAAEARTLLSAEANQPTGAERGAGDLLSAAAPAKPADGRAAKPAASNSGRPAVAARPTGVTAPAVTEVSVTEVAELPPSAASGSRRRFVRFCAGRGRTRRRRVFRPAAAAGRSAGRVAGPGTILAEVGQAPAPRLVARGKRRRGARDSPGTSGDDSAVAGHGFGAAGNGKRNAPARAAGAGRGAEDIDAGRRPETTGRSTALGADGRRDGLAGRRRNRCCIAQRAAGAAFGLAHDRVAVCPAGGARTGGRGSRFSQADQAGRQRSASPAHRASPRARSAVTLAWPWPEPGPSGRPAFQSSRCTAPVLPSSRNRWPVRIRRVA